MTPRLPPSSRGRSFAKHCSQNDPSKRLLISCQLPLPHALSCPWCLCGTFCLYLHVGWSLSPILVAMHHITVFPNHWCLGWSKYLNFQATVMFRMVKVLQFPRHYHLYDSQITSISITCYLWASFHGCSNFVESLYLFLLIVFFVTTTVVRDHHSSIMVRVLCYQNKGQRDS